MEKIVTFCALCNVDFNPANIQRLSLEACQALGMDLMDMGLTPDEAQDGVEINRGVRVGNDLEAQEDGWEEWDYGLVCPVCIVEAQLKEESEDTGIGLEALDSSLTLEDDGE